MQSLEQQRATITMITDVVLTYVRPLVEDMIRRLIYPNPPPVPSPEIVAFGAVGREPEREYSARYKPIPEHHLYICRQCTKICKSKAGLTLHEQQKHKFDPKTGRGYVKLNNKVKAK